jgi:signal transduction histidine kinase
MEGRKYRQSLIKRWVCHYVIVILLITVAFNWIFFYMVERMYYKMTYEYLTARNSVITNFYSKEYLSTGEIKDHIIDKLIGGFADKSIYELQVLDLKGNVIKSSQYVKINYLVPFESKDILTQKWIGKNEYSNENIIVVTSPLIYEQKPVAFVRAIASLENIDILIHKYVMPIRLISFLVMLLILLLSIIFTKSVKRPIDRILKYATDMASGNHHSDIPIEKEDELGHLSETLNFMNNEIERHQKIRNMFISDISHEIKTPLTAISGWTELLLDLDNTDRDTQIKGLNAIKRETDRLQKMVLRLLDYSRIEQENFKIFKTHFDLVEMIKEVIEIYNARMEKLGIKCNLICEENKIPIFADRERLFQCMVNLIDNSVKFRTLEEPIINIFISMENKRVFLRLEDNGLGIEESDKKHIFEKFYRSNESIQGNGLGLSIVKKIIEAHTGNIRLEDNKEDNTVFIIELPID